MKMLGEELSDEEVEQMMKEADENGDGKINFEGNFPSPYSRQISLYIKYI